MRWIVSQKEISPPSEAIILLIDLSLCLSIKREKNKQLIYIISDRVKELPVIDGPNQELCGNAESLGGGTGQLVPIPEDPPSLPHAIIKVSFY